MTADHPTAVLAEQRIAILGCGSLGESLLAGLLSKGHDHDRLSVSSRRPERRAELSQRYGVVATADNQALAAGANIVVLAVKPKQMQQFCRDLAGISLAGKLLVSVAAGIRSDQLRSWLAQPVAIVRSMPNTPAALGLAATGLYADQQVGMEQRALIDQLFAAIGRSVWLQDESLMDLVTAIAGSGPAYYFAIMEAMLSSAIQQGMPADTADLLIRQTALGASSLATAPGAPALAELRQRVVSPGGTTEAALKTLAAQDLAGIMDAALRAAVARGREMAAAND